MITPPAPRMAHVAVVVPAADEQDTIADCLCSIREAVRRAREARPTLSAQVVVVLDRCLDGTEDVVRRHDDVDVLTSLAGSVGAARAQGSSRALQRSPAAPVSTWTAHTDADSVVPGDWLHHQLELADLGAALVLGTVLPMLAAPLLTAWIADHQTGDGHPHVHGANLGIRADALIGLGGWGQQPMHEDADLVARAEFAGFDIRRTGGAVVTTSGRLAGRTEAGSPVTSGISRQKPVTNRPSGTAAAQVTADSVAASA